MQKTLSLIALILFTTLVVRSQNMNAQQYKKLRVGIGVGYAIASGSDSGAGVIGTIEPGFAIVDDVLVNLRFEGAMIVRGTNKGSALEIDYATIASSTINAQYFFRLETLRPFIGAGMGIYHLPAMEFKNFGLPEKIAAESKFGFYPRVGFDVGHFTFCVDYNIIPPSKFEDSEFKNNHVGIRIGFHLGGGRLE
jgi:hypothetical protein